MFGKIKFTGLQNNNNTNNGFSNSFKTKQSQRLQSLQPTRHKPIQKAPKNNKQHRSIDGNIQNQQKIKQSNTQTLKNKSKHTKNNDSHNKLQMQLKGSKFRLLNQMLYTNNSQAALQHFQEHSEDFQAYHQGFRNQASKWQINPLNVIVAYLTKKYWKNSNKITKSLKKQNKLILDMGCGDGQLSQILLKQQQKIIKTPNTIVTRSFDLVASKSHIELADMAHLPVQSNSADICVFCLSLMGVNYLDFVKQAHRVLKKQGQHPGQLLIAEVQSRSDKWDQFVLLIQQFGFSCFKNNTIGNSRPQSQPHKSEDKTHQHKNIKEEGSNYFRIMYFRIDYSKATNPAQQITDNLYKQSNQILKGCLYKRR